ncbi:MAG: PQQ-binding-like beta-propeller repeat protein [Vicinamibacterales bacterium]
MRLATCSVAVLAASVVASLPVAAQRGSGDWIQWRGPQRTGVVTGFNVPKVWPDSLVQKWRVEVGTGYASPLVVGDRIYVFSRRGENEGMSTHELATGKELWRAGYDAPFTMHSAAVPHGQGPKSTPVFVNGRLLSIGMTGVVTAWDAATGKTLWQKPAGDLVPLYTSHAFSPLVDGNLVIFHVGGHDRGALTAFDIGTGAMRWSWPGDGPSYGSPVIVSSSGTRQLVTVTQNKIVAVNPSTGALLWERSFPSKIAINSGTPVVAGDLIIAGGSDGPTAAFTPVKEGTVWTTKTVWESGDIPLKHTNMVVAGDRVIGFTSRNSGQYFAIEARTGQMIWTSPGRQATAGAIVRAGDYIVSLENDGELVIMKSDAAAFELVRKYKVADGETWSEPVLSGERILIKDLNHLTLWALN